MRSRYKTYAEFVKRIAIGRTQEKGFVVFCSLKKYKIVESKTQLWNTEDTKKTFLARLYVNEILRKLNLSKIIQRINGYELLGRRCMYNDKLCIICGWQQMVNTETGETKLQVTLVNDIRNTPFKIFIDQIQL